MLFQEAFFFQVHLNNSLKINEENPNPQKFENVQVFASAKYYHAADALIKNLHLDTDPEGRKAEQHRYIHTTSVQYRSIHYSCRRARHVPDTTPWRWYYRQEE